MSFFAFDETAINTVAFKLMNEAPNKQMNLLAEVIRLKTVPRLGWLLRGVRVVESVAAHSYGVAFVAMLLTDLAKARGHEVDAE